MTATTATGKVLIWDWPLRVFHWAFALCILGALGLACGAEVGSRLFVWHMLLGLAACFLLLIRIFLGFFGGRYNRFPAMLFSPAETARYCWGILTFKPVHYLAHNPGASLAALLMYGLLVALLWTGLKLESALALAWHRYLAYAFGGIVVAHFAGVTANAVHSRGEAALAMLHGQRTGATEEGLASSQARMGLAILVLAALWIGSLCAHFDAAQGTVTLPVLRCTLQLESAPAETPPPQQP